MMQDYLIAAGFFFFFSDNDFKLSLLFISIIQAMVEEEGLLVAFLHCIASS